MNDKLIALQEYVDKQANDDTLWFDAKTAPESYLQKELRHIAWLIEDATADEIQIEVDNYEGRT